MKWEVERRLLAAGDRTDAAFVPGKILAMLTWPFVRGSTATAALHAVAAPAPTSLSRTHTNAMTSQSPQSLSHRKFLLCGAVLYRMIDTYKARIFTFWEGQH